MVGMCEHERMRRCALVLLLALASCGTASRKTVWRGKALDMYRQYLADNPDISGKRKWLLRNDKMPTTLKDYLLLYHLRYPTSASVDGDRVLCSSGSGPRSSRTASRTSPRHTLMF